MNPGCGPQGMVFEVVSSDAEQWRGCYCIEANIGVCTGFLGLLNKAP